MVAFLESPRPGLSYWNPEGWVHIAGRGHHAVKPICGLAAIDPFDTGGPGTVPSCAARSSRRCSGDKEQLPPLARHPTCGTAHFLLRWPQARPTDSVRDICVLEHRPICRAAPAAAPATYGERLRFALSPLRHNFDLPSPQEVVLLNRTISGDAMSRLFHPPEKARDASAGSKGLSPPKPVRRSQRSPEEIITGYLGLISLTQILKPEDGLVAWAWASFIVCLVLPPFYFNHQAEKRKPKVAHASISTLVFAVWLY